MIKISRIILSLVFIYSMAIAENENAKFLVVDGKTFNQIKNLNILNGGIKKDIVITSRRLSKDDLLQYYPEIFLYNGTKCTIINKITLKNNNKRENMLLFDSKKDILKEVKKVKLLQLLNNNNDTVVPIANISKNIIKSVGVICDGSVLLRGKYYNENDSIGSIQIDTIDSINSTIIIKE